MNPGSIAHDLDVARSLVTTVLRSGMGTATRPASTRPKWLFELYDFEGCPYCRLVREALTELDLDATIYPCPKGGQRFRPRVLELGERMQFPFLVDPNTGTRLYESRDIVRHLFENYTDRPLPLYWQWMELQQLGSGLAGLARLGAGVRAAPSRAPEQPLELYSFESSPFARVVRERLSELELPYVLRSAGRSTAADWVPPPVRDALKWDHEPQTVNRRALRARAGRISIPYLVDPNTGTELGESAAILAYLDDTYRS